MYILACYGNGYCGCEGEIVLTYPEDTPDSTINEDVWELAIENAESYSYVHFGWDEECSEEEYEDYIENNVTYDWRVISHEEYVEWGKNWGMEAKD